MHHISYMFTTDHSCTSYMWWPSSKCRGGAVDCVELELKWSSTRAGVDARHAAVRRDQLCQQLHRLPGQATWVRPQGVLLLLVCTRYGTSVLQHATRDSRGRSGHQEVLLVVDHIDMLHLHTSAAKTVMTSDQQCCCGAGSASAHSHQHQRAMAQMESHPKNRRR